MTYIKIRGFLIIATFLTIIGLVSLANATNQCTDTAYNKLTCVQAFLNNSGSCTTGGYTQNGYATVTAGDRLLLWEGMGRRNAWWLFESFWLWLVSFRGCRLDQRSARRRMPT